MIFLKCGVAVATSNLKRLLYGENMTLAIYLGFLEVPLTMYSQFLDSTESLYFEVFTLREPLLSFALLALNLFTHFTWAYGGLWMAKVFASEKAIKIQSKVFGTMLIMVALWLLYQSI